MALIVQLAPAGPNLDQYQYYDYLTGLSLTRSSPISGDLSGFDESKLIHIANAVASSILVVVSGALPNPQSNNSLAPGQ